MPAHDRRGQALIRPDDPDYLAQLDAWLDDLTRRRDRRRIWAAWARAWAELVAAAVLTWVLLWVIPRW